MDVRTISDVSGDFGELIVALNDRGATVAVTNSSVSAALITLIITMPEEPPLAKECETIAEGWCTANHFTFG